MVSIRTFNRGDIEFGLEQTAREGWNSTTASFELCLEHDPEGCFIAEIDGQRVGMVTTTLYRQTGWIGRLIVPPAHRKQGIGHRLMTQAMSHIAGRGIHAIRLEADPPGIKLYRRLGFVDEFESMRFRRAAHGDTQPGGAQPFTNADLPAIAAFDTEYFGDQRHRLLKLLLSRATGSCCHRKDGRLMGYALVIPSRLGLRIGPWIAVDYRTAEVLLRSVLADCPDTDLIVGTPLPNTAAVGLLESNGFTRTPSSYRMVNDVHAAPGCPENIFGIASGAMG